MELKYLTGRGLEDCIREVMAGSNPWMCVAFLGPAWAEELFGDSGMPTNLRVLCDLRMGMTVRTALHAGGAPNNERLRHLPAKQMHAKIYASDCGAVVCSANASCAALSSENRIEDGVWMPPTSKAFRDANETFEARYKEAEQVNAYYLSRAPQYLEGLSAAAAGENDAGDLGKPPTLLQLLHRDPNAFTGIRFVFSNMNVIRAVREGARAVMDEELARNGGAADDRGPHQNSYDYFSNWDMEENEWPALFINVHRKTNGTISLHKFRHLRLIRNVPDGNGSTEDVFVGAKIRWTTRGAAFGDLQKLAGRRECEVEIATLFTNGLTFDDVAGQVLDSAGVLEAWAR